MERQNFPTFAATIMSITVSPIHFPMSSVTCHLIHMSYRMSLHECCIIELKHTEKDIALKDREKNKTNRQKKRTINR